MAKRYYLTRYRNHYCLH